jgi:hypothetical protein
MKARIGTVAAAALIAALFGVAACEFQVARPKYAELSFTHLPPINLDVGRIETVKEYVSPAKPPNVEHLFPVRPSAAAERWGRDRLRAVGSQGVARVIVRQASVVEVPLQVKSGVRGMLTRDQSERYDAVLEIAVEIDKGKGKSTVSASNRRTRTVPEGITLNEREKVWFEMTEAMMRDLNAALEDAIRKSFGSYIR